MADIMVQKQAVLFGKLHCFDGTYPHKENVQAIIPKGSIDWADFSFEQSVEI